MVVPYATCEFEARSVAHVIVAEVVVIAAAVTELIRGTAGAPADKVENVKLGDVAVPEAPTE